MSVDRLYFFPVRHHSPAAARLVARLVEEVRPAAVLVEGPSDFNEQIGELQLEHRLPIAIYSWVVTLEGRRRGAYYPFCEYSPEWQALQAAWRTGAEAAFCDLPWSALADDERAVHRYADGALRRSAYVESLCRRLEVPDFDAAWDRLFEIDRLDLATYLERCTELCSRLRALSEVSETDRRRERFMATRINDALARHEGAVVVVLGGFHLPAVRAACGDEGTSSPDGKLSEDDELGSGRGLALTPYSYQALDNLTGYDSGMPSPGFYHRAWRSRTSDGRSEAWREQLQTIVRAVRKAGHPLSSADVIAAEQTARALGSMRGHAEPWRRDLLDAVITSWLKEPTERGGDHPLLDIVLRTLRGGARGVLAKGTSRPALVRELLRRLEEQDLDPRAGERRLELDLFDERDRARSRLLHAVRLLKIHGFVLSSTPDVLGAGGRGAGEEETLGEVWRLAPHRDFEASAIEAAAYGPTLREAAAARLLERSAGLERDAEAAASLLVDAALVGLDHLSGLLRRRLEHLLVSDPDFSRLAAAAGHLLYLYHYDPILGTTRRLDLGEILSLAATEALARFARLGRPQNDASAIASLLVVLEVFERCGEELGLSRQALHEALERTAGDGGQSPALRGASLGALWSLGSADAERLESSLLAFAGAEEIGDFLSGLFATAREAAQRHPSLVARLDELICSFGEEELLLALPGLRFAFSRFSPREKETIVETLLGPEVDATQILRPSVDLPSTLALRALEQSIEEMIAMHGLQSVLRPERAISDG